MPFFKQGISFPLKSLLPFRVMTHNSTEIFKLKHYMLLPKRARQCTIFQTLSALMKVHPIPHAIFETTRSGFIQILHHCSVSWKITPLYFFSSNLIYFGKFTKSFMSYLKSQVSFSLNFASLFNVMRDNSSILFQLKLYMIFTKAAHQSAKFQKNFDCLSEVSWDL